VICGLTDIGVKALIVRYLASINAQALTLCLEIRHKYGVNAAVHSMYSIGIAQMQQYPEFTYCHSLKE
jgi:hypothetical protein